MNLYDKTLRVAILDSNIFITEVIEEILRNYDSEVIKIKSLQNFNEDCDFLLFNDDSISDELINQISTLPKSIGIKVLINNENKFPPKDLIPFLGVIVHISHIDKELKELFDYYSFLKSDKTFEEEVSVLNKLVKETEEIFNDILINSKYLKDYLGNVLGLDTSLIAQYEELVKVYQEEFVSFEHFNFVHKIPYKKSDLNKIVEDILKEREEVLKLKLKEFKFTPDYLLDEVMINPVVISKLVKNLIELIFMATKEPENLVVTIKSSEDNIQIRFELYCKEYDNRLKIQLYNPFYPRRILENYLINYFRIKIEKYHRIFIRDLFINNKLVFLIILEVNNQ